jgi:hypothetical protein
MTHHSFMYGVCESALKNIKLTLEREEHKEALIQVKTVIGLIELFRRENAKAEDCIDLFNEHYEKIMQEVRESMK